MHLSSWIGGFLLGVVFSTVCAWIDGWFYRRSQRDHVFDYIDRLEAPALERLGEYLAVKMREARRP